MAALELRFPASPLAVRAALLKVAEQLAVMDLPEDDAATVELVLAEVMNNVVEHAYPEDPAGPIELWLRCEPGGLGCDVIDEGRPMPGGLLPEGTEPELPVPDGAEPEGGFGWFLIRSLASDIAYRREGVRNRLRFHLDLAG